MSIVFFLETDVIEYCISLSLHLDRVLDQTLRQIIKEQLVLPGESVIRAILLIKALSAYTVTASIMLSTGVDDVFLLIRRLLSLFDSVYLILILEAN